MQSVSLYRTRMLVEATTGVAGVGSILSILEILAIADLLHDPPDTLVIVDRIQQVVGGDELGGRALGLAAYLDLERAPHDHRDVGPAHPAHDRQDLVIVDLREERPAGRLLGPRADQLEDLPLGGWIG